MIAKAPSVLSLHEWASVQAELLLIYDGGVEPRHRHIEKPSAEPGYCARYVRAGRLSQRGPEGRVEAGAGHWMVSSRDRGRRVFDATDDAHILSIHFLCQWPTGDNFFERGGLLVMADRECPELRKQGERLERLVRRHHPGARGGYAHERSSYPGFLRQQALFLNWLAVWCEALTERGLRPVYGGSDDDRLTRVVRRLNEAPLAQGFPKAQLLADSRLSEGHLDLRFARAFGLSPWRYWERRRLEQARRSLERTDAAVKQIAYETGFRSDAHFVAWFRRLTGRTPGRFRASAPRRGP